MAEIDRIVVIDIEQEGGSTDTPGQEAVRIKADLISTDPSKGAAMVGYRPSDGYPPLTVGNSLNSVQKEISSNKTKIDDAFSKAEIANAKASQALINAGNALQRSANLTDVVSNIESLKNIGGYPVSGSSNTPGADKVPYSVSDGKLSTDWFKDLTYDLAEMKATLDSIRYPDGIVPYIDADFTLGVLHPSVTFSRASETTYFDKYGVMRTAGINEPAFDHDPETLKPLGIQRFNSYTNRFPNSNLPVGFTFHTTYTDTLTGAIPTGTGRMVRLLETTTLADHGIDFDIRLTSGPQTWSFHIKSSGRNIFSVTPKFHDPNLGAIVNLATGEVSGPQKDLCKITKLASGWWRVDMSHEQIESVGGARIYFRNEDGDVVYEGDPTKGFLLWGMQCNDGFAMPYIPTQSSQVTRSDDYIRIGTRNITSTSFTLTMSAKLLGGGSPYPRLISLMEGVDYNNIAIFKVNSSNSFGIATRGSPGIFEIPMQDDFTVAVKVTDLIVAASVSGGYVRFHSALGKLGFDTYIFESPNYSPDNSSGWVKRVEVFHGAVSDSKLIELST